MLLRLFLLLILQALLGNLAFSQPLRLSDCQSMTFSIGQQDRTRTFDVADLRREREELYRILNSQFFQQASFGSDIAKIARPLDFLPSLNKTASSDDSLKKFMDFLGTDAISTSMREMLFSCGSVMDAAAALLSLDVSKTDGERLALLLADPAFDRVATMLPKLASLKTPVGLKQETDKAGERFRLDVIAKCKRFGVADSVCEAFKLKL